MRHDSDFAVVLHHGTRVQHSARGIKKLVAEHLCVYLVLGGGVRGIRDSITCDDGKKNTAPKFDPRMYTYPNVHLILLVRADDVRLSRGRERHVDATPVRVPGRTPPPSPRGLRKPRLFRVTRIPAFRPKLFSTADVFASPAAGRARAFRPRVVMSGDAWGPVVDDTSVPLVGEWKYPVERPGGPVVCTSRCVSVAGAPGVTKQVMRASSDASNTSFPTQNSTVFVHYDMWQRNDTYQEVWSTRRESEPHQIVFGEARGVHEKALEIERKKSDEKTNQSPDEESVKPLDPKRKHHVGLDVCLATMRVGERSLFTIPHQYAYGELGNFSFPSVPPACDLFCDLELIGVKTKSEEPIARSDMLFEERMERVKRHRQQGNDRYRADDIGSASNEYEMALSFLTDDMLMQLFGTYLDDANAEKLPAHLNLAACHLQQKKYNECIDQASRALGLDFNNAKAYYRRGRARQFLGQDDAARSDLLKSLKHSPGGEDAATLRALRDLETEEVKKARARKKTFGGLFGHERVDEDGEESEESDVGESDEDSDSDDDYSSSEKKQRLEKRKLKKTRKENRERRVKDAEAKMDDVDEAGCSKGEEGHGSHSNAGSETQGVITSLFRKLGFGGNSAR